MLIMFRTAENFFFFCFIEELRPHECVVGAVCCERISNVTKSTIKIFEGTFLSTTPSISVHYIVHFRPPHRPFPSTTPSISVHFRPPHRPFPTTTPSISVHYIVHFRPLHRSFPSTTPSITSFISVHHTVHFRPPHRPFPSTTSSISVHHIERVTHTYIIFKAQPHRPLHRSFPSTTPSIFVHHIVHFRPLHRPFPSTTSRESHTRTLYLKPGFIMNCYYFYFFSQRLCPH